MKEVKMCQVTVIGVGHSNNKERTMAMVLREIAEPHRHMPVFIPRHREATFISAIKWYARNEAVDHDVVEDFAMAVGYRIRSVSIHTERWGALTAQMMALGEMGERVTFTVTMHQGVLHAYLRNLPIYIEEDVLNTAEKQVKYKGYDEVSELGLDVQKERVSNSLLGRCITQGVMPLEVTDPTAEERLHESTYAELEILHKLSIDKEQYEWAKIIWAEQEARIKTSGNE